MNFHLPHKVKNMGRVQTKDRKEAMRYAYYPGCSLTGTARRLDKGVKRVFAKLGHELAEIPDWNCCGAFEYGDRKDLIEFSKINLEKSKALNAENGGVVAPCPACYKNLKEADQEKTHAHLPSA